MTRLEYLKKNGLDGARLGIVSIEWLIKYDAYLIYREILDSLKFKKYTRDSRYRTAKSEAIQLAAERCRCDRSCMAKYIYAFERESTAPETIVINRSGHRWVANY